MIVIAGCSMALAQEAVAPPEVPLPRERPEAASSSQPDPNQVELPRERPEAPAAQSPASSSEPSASSEPSSQPEVETPQDAVDEAPAVTEPVAPPRDYQVACPVVLQGQVTASALPPIEDGQCKIQSPLSLEAVMANGRSIPLSAPVTTDCSLATALPGWIADVDAYLKARDDTQIEMVNVGTAYACRNVNNASDGNLSFHAFGNALDVMGFTLEDGRNITVETAWPGTEEQGSRLVRFAHDAACTRFTTVLGPEANALHYNHLHVDLGCHGQSCEALICE